MGFRSSPPMAVIRLWSPTYVTYVELRQNLTGPSTIPTTPKRGIASLDSPGQQRVGIWRTASPDRRHIRERQQELSELIFEVLETLDAVQIVRHRVRQFRVVRERFSVYTAQI